MTKEPHPPQVTANPSVYQMYFEFLELPRLSLLSAQPLYLDSDRLDCNDHLMMVSPRNFLTLETTPARDQCVQHPIM